MLGFLSKNRTSFMFASTTAKSGEDKGYMNSNGTRFSEHGS